MKRNILSLILFLFSILSAQSQNSLESFLKEQNTSAKDYIISLFENYDIVIFCEREHAEFTQYELIKEIVSDPYFIEHVGHIYTEVGVTNIDERINKFLVSPPNDSISMRKQVTEIFRDADSTPYWMAYSFPWLLMQISELNRSLPSEKRLLVHPSDVEFDWYKVNSAKDYQKAIEKSYNNRDSIMARNIIHRYDSIYSSNDTRKKAFVIMNYKHAFLKDHYWEGNLLHNTGRYLADEYKGKVASVYLMGLAITELGSYFVVKNGEWDYLFESLNKTDIGFSLKNTPFGKSMFDAIPKDSIKNFNYEDIFTGLLYYKPLKEQTGIRGWRDFTSDEFTAELRRRIRIFNDWAKMNMTSEDIEKAIWENNQIKKTNNYYTDEIWNAINQWTEKYKEMK